jgi:hypothetical protein
MTLLAVVSVVLSGIAGFFVYVAKKSATLSDAQTPDPSVKSTEEIR